MPDDKEETKKGATAAVVQQDVSESLEFRV